METIATESVGLSSSRLQRIDRAMQGYIDREQLTGLITVLLRRGEVADYHMPDGTRYQGLDLPQDVLEKIYSANFERLYGTAPASLTETK